MDNFKSPFKDFSEFRYGWRSVIAGFVAMITGAPTLAYYSIGFFAPHLTTRFGWSYSFTLSGLTVMMFALLPLGPLMGWLTDRFGVRGVGAVSMALFGLSFMALGLSTGSKIQYGVTWLLIAVFGVGATPIVSTRAINALFRRRRGLALGLAFMGSGIMVAMLKLTGQSLIHAVGWRWAFIVVGAVPFAIGAPVILWGFPKKSASKVSVDEALEQQDIAKATGLTVSDALASRRFWIMLASFLPTALAGAAPMANMENILRSAAVPVADIPGITALIGLSMIVGRLAGGWIIDRVWAPLVTFVVVGGGAYGCFLLSQGVISHGQAVSAVALLGLTAGVELDLMSYLVVRYMGLRRYGVIYGLLYALFFIAAGLGPSLMAHRFDRTGSYGSISLLFCGLLAFASVVILLLGRYPDFTQASSREERSGCISA